MRFSTSGKRRRLFMSHMNPLNLFLCANRVRDAVERVAGNTVNLPNSCFSENIHQQVRYFFRGHDAFLSEGMKEKFNFSPMVSLPSPAPPTPRSAPPQFRWTLRRTDERRSATEGPFAAPTAQSPR